MSSPQLTARHDRQMTRTAERIRQFGVDVVVAGVPSSRCPWPMLQLALTDENGKFPWDVGYDWRPQPKPGGFRA